MKAIITIILSGWACLLTAQSPVIHATIKGNGLEAIVNVDKGYTVYSLSKAFGTSVQSILETNSMSNPSLSIGKDIKISLDPSKLSTSYATVANPRAINVTTTKGDNLYRLSKASGLSSEIILALNGRQSEDLKTGETILIGWIDWPYNQDVTEVIIPEEVIRNIEAAQLVQGATRTTNTSTELTSQNSTFSAQLVMPKPEVIVSMISQLPIDHTTSTTPYILPQLGWITMADAASKKEEIKTEKGIAYWEKSNYAQTELIAMHPTAKVNSKISLYNPMLKRKVEAKVVGELPSSSYADDVSIVISPSVADALGALDRRFQVEITYVE